MKIWNYIARFFCWYCIIVAFGLISLFSFLALLEALDDVGKGDFTTFHAIQIVLLTSGMRLIELLPVIVVLSSLLTIGGLANNRELLIIRAVGVSKRQLVYVLSSLGLMMSLLSFLLLETLIPSLEKTAHELSALTLEKTTIGANELWTRQGLETMRIGNLDSHHIPRQLEIYETDLSGSLIRFIEAEKAYFQEDRNWILFNVSETIFSDTEITESKFDSLSWNSFLSKEQFERLVAPPTTLSTLDLIKHLNQNKILAVDSSNYSSILWKKISLPLTLIAMATLSIPLLTFSTKPRSSGYHAVIGGAIGIFFYLIEQTTSNLDQLLGLPPALTSLAPPIIIITITLLLTRRAI